MIELENAGQVGLRHFVFVEWDCTREKPVGGDGLDSGVKGRFSGTIRFGLCGGLRWLSTSAAFPFCRRCSPTPPTD